MFPSFFLLLNKLSVVENTKETKTYKLTVVFIVAVVVIVVVIAAATVVITVAVGVATDCDSNGYRSSDGYEHGGVGEAVIDLKYVKETMEFVVVVVVMRMVVVITKKVTYMDMYELIIFYNIDWK